MIFWLALWHIAACAVGQRILRVSPIEVVRRLFILISQAPVWQAALFSTLRIAGGFLLALLAQGYTPEQTCRIGAYVHGMAGDIAAGRMGEISMNASDIVNALPEAWKNLTNT